ncbi:MAG: antibiotic biosynthesis monooxygenase [Oscillospiraceae bacterium]|jgi:quinol monooxygenase YgiN|nr:antibiotic biosynthesis monooxygenase [Oscillospiraceae bacterium]
MVICNCLFTSETTDMKDFYPILCSEGLVEGSRADKGNILYDFYISADDPKRMMLIEKWESIDDLQAHSETELFQKFRPVCKASGVRTKLAMYEE